MAVDIARKEKEGARLALPGTIVEARGLRRSELGSGMIYDGIICIGNG